MRVRAALTAACLAGCAHLEVERPPADRCAQASLVVLRDAATASAVDPVETQRAVLQSSAFAAAAGAASPAAKGLSIRTRRFARSAVLFLEVVSAQPGQAQAACGSAVETAFVFGKEGLDFLEQQLRSLEGELAPRAKAVQDFLEKSSLVAVGLAERQEIERSRHLLMSLALVDPAKRSSDRKVAAAMEEELRRALAASEQESLRLSALEAQLAQLTRERDGVQRRVDLVRTRLAEATLDGILHQELRLLDRCAPCDAR